MVQTLRKSLQVIKTSIIRGRIAIILLTVLFIGLIVFCTLFPIPDADKEIIVNPGVVKFSKVFLHNILVFLFQEFMGISTFGLYGIFAIYINALSLGTTFSVLYSTNKLYLVYKMVIHGTIESCAIVLNSFFSFYFWVKVFKNVKLVFLKKQKLSTALIDMCFFTASFTVLFLIMYLVAGVFEKLVSYF
ncbi:stage II sporulation protein M [[Clostridium] cellulosi]